VTSIDNIRKRCGFITSHSLYGRLSPMRADKLNCGDLLEVLAVMRRGKTPWARGDGLGLGVVVRSRVVLSKCIGQVTLWGAYWKW